MRAAMRGADLTRRLLALARRQILDPNVVDLNRQLTGLADLMQRTLGESIEVRMVQAHDLWYTRVDAGQFENAILKPYGMVLVTGPTGSGKTNTLYSALSRINTPEVNIITAEDPVEFNLPGINQVQMKEQIGLNFAAALRSFLRQDPNIILVGEIRDFETAEVAIKAAMTGHLVLSTLHTNDAPSSINRLMNMGIEPFLVATSVHLIAAQRLVRRICSSCKEPTEAPMNALVNVGFSERDAKSVRLFKGRGCDRCSNTGYKGRISIHEIMWMVPELQEAIVRQRPANELKDIAVKAGMRTLRQTGLRKVANGLTTIDEVLRVTFAD